MSGQAFDFHYYLVFMARLWRQHHFLLYSTVSLLSFAPPIMQIFIKTLTGRKQAFNFEPENQVLAVKQALQEKEGIQVDQIRLVHSGKQLYVLYIVLCMK